MLMISTSSILGQVLFHIARSHTKSSSLYKKSTRRPAQIRLLGSASLQGSLRLISPFFFISLGCSKGREYLEKEEKRRRSSGEKINLQRIQDGASTIGASFIQTRARVWVKGKRRQRVHAKIDFGHPKIAKHCQLA